MSSSKTIAVIYGVKGGMGDVGKFAAKFAAQKCDLKQTKIIAMSQESIEGNNTFERADVKDQKLNDELEQFFTSQQVCKLNTDDQDMQNKLESELVGVDAVVACLGNREFNSIKTLGHWQTTAAKAIVAAMKNQQINRLVILSSMGVGDDFLPLSPLKLSWAGMLKTSNRKAGKDLKGQEAAVKDSDLDYLIVRPMQIDPNDPPVGTWKLLTAKGQGSLSLQIAKPDVAQFMVQEAIEPTFHKAGVTIGREKKKR